MHIYIYIYKRRVQNSNTTFTFLIIISCHRCGYMNNVPGRPAQESITVVVAYRARDLLNYARIYIIYALEIQKVKNTYIM